MIGTLLNLRKQLPENTIEILRSVERVAEALGISSFIVGATARDIVLEYVHAGRGGRATSDVDFGVAVENWEEFENLKGALIERENFRADSKMQHRLWRGRGPEEMKIDLIPYGGLESPPGSISFPPTGFEMNTNGFREAFETALKVQISDNLQVKVASLAGIAVLKFIAYNDRPQERQTDMEDVLFIAKNYLDADNDERLYEDNDLMKEEDFDLRAAGARLLGRDIARLLTPDSSKIVLGHLSEGSRKEDDSGLTRTAEVMVSRSRAFNEDFEEAVRILHELRRGIMEGK